LDVFSLSGAIKRIFYAHVEDSDGKEVYTVTNEDEEGLGEIGLVDWGYMKHGGDVQGLEQYLKEMDILEQDDVLEFVG